MSQKKVCLLHTEESEWVSYLQDFFEETTAEFLTTSDAEKAASFIEGDQCELLLVTTDFLTPSFVSKIKVIRARRENFKIFTLSGEENKSVAPDYHFSEIPEEQNQFLKQFVSCFEFPAEIKVLLIDDEDEIREMISEYLNHRKEPSFNVVCASNGEEGLLKRQDFEPDVIVLDVKMPKMDGIAFYKTLREMEILTPVILFFDAIFGDEIAAIQELGRFAVVEKGARQSSPPQLQHLIQKMFCFG